MYKRYAPLLLLLSAFFVFGVSAFGAKATSPSGSPGNVAEFAKPAFNEEAAEAAFLQAPSSRTGVPAGNASLGYYLVAGTVTAGTAGGFDHQSNDRQQRQIVVGCLGNIHNVYMYRPFSGGDREIHYTAYVPGSAPAPYDNPISPGTGGYSAIDAGVATGGLAVVAWHYTYATDTSYTVSGMQPSCASSAFPMNLHYPFPPNCQGIKTGRGMRDNYYIWPSVAVDDHGGQPIAHVVSMEYNGTPVVAQDTTGKKSLIYYKSVDGINGGPAATCGTFIDSIYSANSVVVADPNSQKVAIVYARPRSWTPPTSWIWYGRDNVVYRESNDLGATWGSMVQVTNYSDTEELIEGTDGKMFVMRADEISALYDDSSHLHIVWKTQWQDSATAYYLIYPTKLFHWDNSQNCISMIFDASNYGAGSNCTPGGGANNLSKPNLTMCDVGGQKRFYAVYTRFRSYITSDSTYLDCCTHNYQNGEVYVQGSMNYGRTWGDAINLSNTATNGCAAGACNSENFTNAAMYVNDSLRIQYLLDKDAGNRAVYTEGVETDNPIMNLSYECFAVPEVRNLTADPEGFTYPLMHTTPGSPGSSTTETLTLTNTGNGDAHYTRSVVPAASWLSFPDHPSNTGTVPAGCVSTEVFQVRATGVATEGLYATEVQFAYEDGKVLHVPVEMWCFRQFHLPVDISIRTALVRLNTHQHSRAAAQLAGSQFYYISDAQNYMFDGSLVIGTSSTTISTSIFAGGSGSVPPDPLIAPLYALSDNYYDSTTSSSYRIVSGSGCNRDTTIAFDVEWYAPRHVDSSNFIIGCFDIFVAPKFDDDTVRENVTIAYGTDWDIPDVDDNNQSGFDEPLQMVYQQGVTGTDATRFGALAGVRDDDVPLPAGFVLDNPTWVYPHGGYENDSIWTKMQTAVGYSAFNDSLCDMNSMLVFARGLTLKAGQPFTVYLIFAGQPANGSLALLQGTVQKAQEFIKKNIKPRRWKFHSKQDGDLKVWWTRNCKVFPPYRFHNRDYEGSTWATGRVPWWVTDVLIRFKCATDGVMWYRVVIPRKPGPFWELHPLRQYIVESVPTVERIPLFGTQTGPQTDSLYCVANVDSVRLSHPDTTLASYPIVNGRNSGLSGYLFDLNQAVYDSTAGGYPFSAPTPLNRTLYYLHEFVLINQECNTCGDANGDGTYDISDAVFLIQYIFVPGSPAPGPCGAPDGLGDANGDTAVDISDAVYLIQYIFVPGSPAPTCP